MSGNQQVKTKDNSQEFDISLGLKSLRLTNVSIDLPADTTDAIEKTLRHVDSKAIVEDFFLQSLGFSTMDDREGEIMAAHKATFEWIFNCCGAWSPKSNGGFMSWLIESQRHNVYWMNGKAGSGKSTLMRYVYENPKTTDGLKAWAAEMPLICPRFFFWTSGTIEQKSASGLLRSLLHQMLYQMREMMPWIFPDMWLKYQDTKTRIRQPIVWTVDSLRLALQKFLRLSAGTTKICFFIDGLDEVEGNQKALVELLHSMVQTSPEHIKACVSSRPWKVFEEAFADIPQLKLQDLTRNDIWRYVDDNLKSTLKIHRILQKDEKAAEILKNQITENADGVFLWADLAVKNLVNHSVSTDTVADLLQRHATLPTDLDRLFRCLLFESKTNSELEEQSRILQIMRAREVVCDFTRHDSSNSVTLYQMALANQDKSFEFTNEPAPLPEAEVSQHCGYIKSLLLDRCAGLLRVHQNSRKRKGNQEEADSMDVQSLAQSRIGYLHRTVRDFFVYSGDFESIAMQTNRSQFDPHISLLKSQVLQLKFPLQQPERHRMLDEWWPDIVLAMTHARYSNPTFGDTQVELLNHFKSTLDWYWIPKRRDPLDNWARNAFASYEQRMKYRTPYHYPFLSLATKFGLCHYVKTELDTGKYPYNGGIPLLSYAVEFLASRRQSVYPYSSPELVEILLDKDQDLNLVYKNLANKDETPWVLTLKYTREADRKGWINENDCEGIKRWVMIVKSFIEHGADPNALIEKDIWDPAATALDILTMIDEKYQLPGTKTPLDTLLQHGATRRAVET